MLKIRFLRTGKKNQPFFRIVVTDSKRPPKRGRFVEVLGFYNPLIKEKSIKKERVEYWLSQGAQASDSCHNLFVKEGIIKGTKHPVHKKTKKKETKKSEAKKQKSTEIEVKKQEPMKEEKEASDKKTEEPEEPKTETERKEEKKEKKEDKTEKPAKGKKKETL